MKKPIYNNQFKEMVEIISQVPSLEGLQAFLTAFTVQDYVVIFILVWILGRAFKYIFKKTPRINADVKNGLLVLVAFSQFTILLLATALLLSNLGVQFEIILGSMAILATAIGVSFTGVAANFIGGMYILTTRPFRVGDFIKTQGIEGIVEEIGINFTRLTTMDRTIVKIPNGNLLNTSLLNFTERTENSNFTTSSGLSRQFVTYKKMIELKLDITTPPISIKRVREGVDHVCNEFGSVFGVKPEYYLGRHDFRQEIYLIIRAIDGYTIFNVWPYFMERIATAVYQELQQEISL
ncbi:MAG: mechanosensitive ion channel family protein [Candidatus Heimdallarchaeota archaeon]